MMLAPQLFVLEGPTGRLLMGSLALALSGVAGFLVPPTAGDMVTARPAFSAPVFVHPGAVMAEAARRMGAPVDALIIAAPEVDLSVDVTPAPPPVDVADTFRRELSAVVTEAGVHTVVFAGADRSARRLRVGSPYRDGWRVQAIDARSVVLSRRGDTRRVMIMGSYLAAPDEMGATTDAPAPRRLALSRQDARGGSR